MTVELSTVIMTHPSRLDRAERLARRHPELHADIIVDPKPHAEPSALRTAAVAWSYVRSDATHHLVLQDDAVPCRDFRKLVCTAVEQYPDAGLALFTEWSSLTAHHLRMVAMGGGVWTEVLDEYAPTVAMVLPAELAREFGNAATEHGQDWHPADDVALLTFLMERNVPILCRIPTLVEHDEGDSLTGNAGQGPRHSVCFADDVTEPCDDERLGLADLLPTFSHYLTPDVGSRPFVAQRQPVPTTRANWWIRPAAQWLDAAGFDAARIAGLARSRVDAWRAGHDGLDDPMLDRLWLLPYTMGACLIKPAVRLYAPSGGPVEAPGALPDAAALERVLARPVVRRAFATLPQAALHPAADRETLSGLSQPLTELMVDAVRQGFEDAHDELRRS